MTGPVAPLDIVFGVIGRRQITESGEEGRGLATAGMVIGIVFTALAVIPIVLVIVLGLTGAAGSGL